MCVISKASGGAFMFGILLGWSAPAASQIIERHEDDFYFWITNSQFTWIVAMMPLGAVFSCVLSGIIRNIIGTRFTFLLFGIPILIGLTLLTIPLNPGMLIAGRFLCGISIGCYSYIVPIYVGEIASNKIRGRLLSLFQVCLNFGILFIYILGHFTTYRVFNIVCGILSIFYSFGCLVLPESPPFLIRKQRELDADYSLKILRGKSFNTYEEIQMLKRQHQEFLNQKKTITEIFKTKTTLKAFFIIMLQFTFLQMTGINAVLFFSTIIFNEAKINLEPGIASIIVASVLVCATFLSVTFVDRFGRKFLLISSNILMFFGLCGIGTYFTLKDEGNNIDALTWLPGFQVEWAQ
ncbi:CLUMA_CG015229, isoform A [Clunio marinus]|uniref:CLUMA_CG015229, isoform A n=1 Tax=Clunio marinus TaxID=568069 RepID=A0A1J1IR34_9DIPT|nr:CLUMA_CG015229, isoform A [Clunio marinus]